MTGTLTGTEPCEHEGAPAMERLNYYFGQQLGVCDFLDEQRYFREKIKLHNRCLHGHGIVSGLLVSVPKTGGPQPHTDPKQTAQKPDHPDFKVEVACGLALDPAGNELYVP